MGNTFRGRCRVSLLAMLAVTCLLFGTAGSVSAIDDRAPVAPPDLDQAEPGPGAHDAVLDGTFLSRAVQEGDRLIAEKKSTEMKTLVEQLGSRKVAELDALPGEVEAAEAPKRLAPEEVYERAAAATVIMGGLYKCDKCSHTHCTPASGFVVMESGVVATNYHVLDAAKNMTVVAMTRDGKVFPVKEVLAGDKAKDVALVRLDLGEVRTLPALPLTPHAKVGSDVFVLSHPNNRFFSFTRGTVSRYFSAGRTPGEPVLLQITADYAKGSSGAPVLNAMGQVIGMVAATTSVYYNDDANNPRNLQMVFKDCVTAQSILDLVKHPPPAPAASARH